MAVLIKDIQRNSNEIIRIEVSEFKGKELINIRIWFQSIDNKSGDIIFKPTQKGIALNINEFAQLKDGIDKLEQYINDRNKGAVPEQPEQENVMQYDDITEEGDEPAEEEESDK